MSGKLAAVKLATIVVIILTIIFFIFLVPSNYNELWFWLIFFLGIILAITGFVLERKIK